MTFKIVQVLNILRKNERSVKDINEGKLYP